MYADSRGAEIERDEGRYGERHPRHAFFRGTIGLECQKASTRSEALQESISVIYI